MNHQVDAVTKKANSTIIFLRCNTSKCPRPEDQSNHSEHYHTSVRTTLEYASIIWDPTTKQKIRKPETPKTVNTPSQLQREHVFDLHLHFFYKHLNTIIINQHCPELEHAHIIHEICTFYGSGLLKEEG